MLHFDTFHLLKYIFCYLVQIEDASAHRRNVDLLIQYLKFLFPRIEKEKKQSLMYNLCNCD